MTHQLCIYDTTLRDGAQREGLSLSLDDKLRIARQLDSLGIPFIEGGWPGANPKDVQFFWKLQEQPLVNSEVVAFCSTRRPNSNAAEDDNLKAILSAGNTLDNVIWEILGFARYRRIANYPNGKPGDDCRYYSVF